MAGMVTTADVPRVNFALLERHQGRRVLLLAETDPTRIDGSGFKATVKTCDNGDVQVALKHHAAFESRFVEFEGTVTGPNQLQEDTHVDVGNAVDMPLYNELVKLGSGPASKHFR